MSRPVSVPEQLRLPARPWLASGRRAARQAWAAGTALLLSISSLAGPAEDKTDILRRLDQASREVGGELRRQYREEILPLVRRKGEIGTLLTGQGSRLSMLSLAPDGARETTVILLGKGSSWFEHLELALDQYRRGRAVYLLDQAGQGLSSRTTLHRNVAHVESFEVFDRDFDEFMERVVRPRSRGPLHMLTHSTGSAIGHSYLLRKPGVFADAVHVAPFFSVKLPGGVPQAAVRRAAGFLSWRNGPSSVGKKAATEPAGLVGERQRFLWALNRAFQDRTTIVEGVSPRWVSEVMDRQKLLLKEAGAIGTPFRVIQAGLDDTVGSKAQLEIARRAPSGTADVVLLPSLEHSFLYQEEGATKDVLRIANQFFEGERAGQLPYPAVRVPLPGARPGCVSRLLGRLSSALGFPRPGGPQLPSTVRR